jgi:hypothetical protein
MNAGQRMARIAVGAAVENIMATAQFNGLSATSSVLDHDRVGIQLDGEPGATLRIDDSIRQRCTNRKPYEAVPVSASVLAALTSTLSGEDVRTHWLTNREQLRRVAEIVRESDGLLFGNQVTRRAFLANVRFDAPDAEPVEYGLSLASMEVRAADRSAFRLLPRLPQWLVKLMRVGHKIGRQSEGLVNSSAGLFVAATSGIEPAADFSIGRAMQRAWLALTQHGLSAQPMMSLAVLHAIVQHGSEPLKRCFDTTRIQSLHSELKQVVSCLSDDRVGFLLRFGHATPPGGRCARRSLRAALVEES